uniref:Uncharacterized protein n=1 Tax=Davidia involucrata TaxID=16924 RepID=A0A5B7ATL5_DAVIN
MEAVFLHSSSDQSISHHYKHISRNPKKNNRPLISRPSENFAPSSLPPNSRGGLLNAPPPSLSYSYPLSVSLLNPNSRSRGLSCPPVNRKLNNRKRDQSLTPKKSKPSLSSKKQSTECLIVASTNRLGPDPKDLPKDVSSVLSGNNNNNNLEKFSGSIFTLSPPPSSLPLPTFSLRPKVSCNAEVAGIDAGATDSLRRLLRLR